MQISRFLSIRMVMLSALAVAANSAMAVEIASEPFDYPASLGAGLNGVAGGTGWASAWSDVNALPTIASTNLSLEYPTGVLLSPMGGRIEVTAGATNDPAERFFGSPMSLALSDQTYYSSALFRRSAVTGELTSVLFDRVTGGAVARWYYGIDTNGNFSVAVDPSTPGQRATSTFLAEAGVTYLVVSKFRTNTGPLGNDEVFLQVFEEGDVIAEPSTDDAWDLRANGNSGVMLERVRLAMSNTAGETNEFDELRVGTSFADVTGVPEPGAASLLLCGAALVSRRRRR